MAMLLALQHPEDVSKLTIADSLPPYGALFGVKDTAAMTPDGRVHARCHRVRIMCAAYAQGETNFFCILLVKSPAGFRAVAVCWACTSTNPSLPGPCMTRSRPRDIRARGCTKSKYPSPCSIPCMLFFIFLVWHQPNGKMRLRSPVGGSASRRGCDRSTLGSIESEAQPDPSALLRPELEPLPERRLNHASSNLQE